jgi:cystine transport system permease protein
VGLPPEIYAEAERLLQLLFETLPFLKTVLDALPFLLWGSLYTILLSVGGMGFGLVIGFALALMRLSERWPLTAPARAYISFIRGTPLLVQLFLIYYGLAQFGLRLDPIPAAMLGFSMNVGGYSAEIIRAAISSIDRGQWEAAASVGLSTPQALRLVILPQASRVAIAPLSNSFISLVKDTSLAATIQVPELFRQAQLITARTFEIFTMYLATAAIYWVLSSLLAYGQGRLEARASRYVSRQ